VDAKHFPSSESLINQTSEVRALFSKDAGCNAPTFKLIAGQGNKVELEAEFKCSIPCPDQLCENPLKRKAIIYTKNKIDKSWQTRPGQMLLLEWSINFAREEKVCCFGGCGVEISITQLEFGWDCGERYEGPDWAPDVDGPCPEPKDEDFDKILEGHKEQVGK
jgi:hypothetical protein